MSIIIREADLELDRGLLIDVLSRDLSPLINAPRYDWLYLRNPYGKARAWIATDSCNNTIVGVAGAFSRRMYVNSREELAWVLGDFCINERYRSLGPALQLQRACLENFQYADATFCYDFPSQSMMAVYKRLHISPGFSMSRLALPLRVDRKVRERVSQPLAYCLSGLGNMFLNFYNLRVKVSKAVTIELQNGHYGEEFSILSRQAGSQYGVGVKRSAAYLNWRYLDHQGDCYKTMTARVNSSLAAYAVFTQKGENATLIDLFGVNDSEVIYALIINVATFLRRRGAVALSVLMSDTHPWITYLHNLGFKNRETNPVVTYYGPRLSKSEEMNWSLMHVDRES